MGREPQPFEQLVRVLFVAGLICWFAFLSASCSDRGTQPETWVPWQTADIYPAWSPDSQYVAFVRKEIDTISPRFIYTLWQVNVSTKALSFVRDLSDLYPYGLTWDRDGKWLAFPTLTGLFKINPSGDSLVQLTNGQDYDSPSWSHTGDQIFFAINGGDEQGIWSINPDGSNPVRWNDPYVVALAEPFCFPNSDTLVVYSYVDKEFCLSTYVPGEDHIAERLTCKWHWPAKAKVSPDMSRVIAIGRSGDRRLDLFSISRHDGSVEQITTSMTDRDDLGFDISPDGSRIVYTEYLRTGGLAVMELSTGESIQLTPGREADY